MNRIILTAVAALFALFALFTTAAAAANCDPTQGRIDLAGCPVERAQLDREARALAWADQLCRSTRECDKLGTHAFKTGNWRLAIHYYEQQASHAEHERNPLDTALAYHNAALAHLRGRNCLDARDWLDSAAALDPHGVEVERDERLFKLTCDLGD